MLISELEEKLKALREEHGDLKLYKRYESDTSRPSIMPVSKAEYSGMCTEWYGRDERDDGKGVIIE